MPMIDFRCEKCGFSDEFYIGPNYKDNIPERCPSCNDSNLEKQFPDISKVGVDVVGGFEYVYGKKNWRKGKSADEQAGYLVKGDDGKYKDPY